MKASTMRWRLWLVGALTLLSVYWLVPSVIYLSQPYDKRNDHEFMRKMIPKWMPDMHLNLGLDLQGGVQLVLGVDLAQAVENRLAGLATDISHWTEGADAEYGIKTAYVVKGQTFLRVELKDGTKPDKLLEAVRKNFPRLEKTRQEGNFVDFAFRQDQVASIRAGALEQAERVVRSRVDKWGVTEPIITRRADGSILAQLPGFKDPEKARELLGRTAQLKFKIVDDEFKGLESLAASLPPEIQADRSSGQLSFSSEDRDALLKLTAGKLPPDREVLLSREQLAGGKKYRYQTYVVRAATELSGEDVLDANVTEDQRGLTQTPAVSLKFSSLGAKRFEDITGRNTGKRMAIILDDIVESAPVINQRIAGGSAIITLGGNRPTDEVIREATELSMVLKSGALPATITINEQRQVGASLGPELARRGILGVVVGLAAVCIFMVFFYRLPGVIACAALLLNGLYVLATMALFGFALTLPGIAGFILGLGMAVDANVLINERMRQELREGKAPRAALENGFKKVFWTVIDSHVTAILAAFILLGTNTSGPIRGFAVTLAIGLVVSLFTSLFISHLFFDIAIVRAKNENSVKSWLGVDMAFKERQYNFKFLKFDTAATIGAIAFSVLVVIGGALHGFNWSVDFVGGTELEVAFNQDIEADALRKVAHDSGVEELSIQALKGGKQNYLIKFGEAEEPKAAEPTATTPAQNSVKVHKFQEVLSTELASAQPQVLRVDFVGPQIGKELRNEGFISLVYAIIGIMIYLSLRFDFRFGTGAVVKLIPDTFAILAFYLFFDRPFDLTTVAALLTGIGYSVNDVIVVYDRIRENLSSKKQRSFAETIELSINETLVRTVKTSVVTSLSLVGIVIFGPDTIRNFAIAMIVGIAGATFTSIFIGSGYLLWIDKVMKKRESGALPKGKVATQSR